MSKKTMYAILYKDSWDGESDTYYFLAYQNESGEWFDYNTDKKLIDFGVYGIIKKWRLK